MSFSILLIGITTEPRTVPCTKQTLINLLNKSTNNFHNDNRRLTLLIFPFYIKGYNGPIEMKEFARVTHTVPSDVVFCLFVLSVGKVCHYKI